MTARDPRRDPKPGDVLRKHGAVRQIEPVTGTHLTWVMSISHWGVCGIQSWCKWAATAEVVKRAEDAIPCTESEGGR